MKQLFKGQISCKAVFSKQARDSYYHGILAATEVSVSVFQYIICGFIIQKPFTMIYENCLFHLESGGKQNIALE